MSRSNLICRWAKRWKLLVQLAPANADRLYITYGGQARELPNTDPVTRAILRGFLYHSNLKDVNNVNVRSVAKALGSPSRKKKSDEPVTLALKWCMSSSSTMAKADLGKPGFASSVPPNNPRIVRLSSQSVEIPITGTLLLLNNTDKPGIVGYLGTLLGKHHVNIASMSLGRDTMRRSGRPTVLSLNNSAPALLAELQKGTDISNVKVVTL